MIELGGERVNVTNEHNCFGCGRLNAHGLQMEFLTNPEGDGVWSRVILAPRFEGYQGVIHGGIISTLLDEAMAWSLYRDDIWAVTGQLSIRFRKPVIVGVPVLANGHIGARRGRIIEMRGDLRRESDGQVLAEATATFVRVPDAQAAAWREQYQGEHLLSSS